MPILMRGKPVATDAEASARVVDAARHRGHQRAYCLSRERRLLALRARLDRWLDATPETHHLWAYRNSRAIAVQATARRYRALADDYADKVDALAKGRSPKAQEAITAAFFTAVAETPTRRPEGVPSMGRVKE